MKSIAVSADGVTAVVVLFDSTIAVWHLPSGSVRCMLQKKGERDSTRVHSGGVNAVYLTPDGRQAVTISKDTTARVWDLEEGECTRVLQGSQPSLDSGSGDAELERYFYRLCLSG